ncbi:MAG: hypothetical protein ACU84Q_03140 [Gammaproteobacteria bacterium]
MNKSQKPTAYLAFLAALGALIVSPLSYACDTDAECGPGGICIKREKRARGVCYGGGQSEPSETAPGTTDSNPVISTPPVNPASPSPSGDAPVFGEEGYVEPSAPPRMIDQLDLPERSSGACITSTDCAGGQECIYRDPMLGHGTCEAPP